MRKRTGGCDKTHQGNIQVS
ncbi:hypothetical protein M8C21_019955 [Ambrosia artemisiifolia]|uniref:Uncharacterized protein n=1 Tax=Ambrosia artemisiifolia TaxID=4212 RepID=A0AAD5GHP3_AMBAR|nr:hypothetical protein M8C21_019955 [Ambrosia artemisiifolia]